MQALRLVCLGLLVLTVNACGFALRGSEQAALSFDRMTIIQPGGFYPLADTLAQVLRANGVSVPELTVISASPIPQR